MSNKMVFNKSQLIEVIYQLKYPTILKINNEEPAEFQEIIREEFPNYNVNIERQQEIKIDGLQSTKLPTLIPKEDIKNYSFVDRGGEWKVNLTRNFISISTNRYISWEDLNNRFNKIKDAFERIYKPTYYSRIGLRYENAISKKSLNLESKKWSQLINTNLIGVINMFKEEDMRTFNMDARYKYKEYEAHLQTALGNTQNDNETKFIIDTDYYTVTDTNIDEVDKVSNDLHSGSKEFINKAFTKILENAMEPKKHE